MNSSERYRQSGRRRAVNGVSWFDGVDSVTREPVLIYEFEGDPTPGIVEFDSKHACKVIDMVSSGNRHQLITEVKPGWKRWSGAHGPLSSTEMLGLARALRDAEAYQVVHGGISASHIVLVHGRAMLSGFGVPWSSRPEEGSDDVRDFARLLMETGLEDEDDTVLALLAQCVQEDPSERPSAEELCLALESIYPEEAVALAGPPPPAPRPAAGTDPVEVATFEDEHDIELREMERVATRRRLGLLAVLFLSIVVLALMALYGPRLAGNGIRAGQEATFYVVEVDVEPANLPPVTIHLISSPEGSELQRGRVLGTAPRHLALDRPGVWAFQGVLQDRRSEIVEITVPEQRSLTLSVPSEPVR